MPSYRRSSASLPLALVLAASVSSLAAAQGVETVRNAKTGLVSWMSLSEGGAIEGAAGSGASLSFEQAALDFLGRQSAAFGLRTGSAELSATKTTLDEDGAGFVRVQQSYKGLPIIGAELMVALDSGRNVVSVNGRSVGDVDVPTKPEVSAADARKSAIHSTSNLRDVSILQLAGSEPVLSVHDARVMGGRPASPALVWLVEVTSTSRPEIHEIVLINARNGRVAVQFSQTPHATAPANAVHQICDAANSTTKLPCTPIDADRNPGASAVPDVRLAYVYAERAYDFFARRFNRNSIDDRGMPLVATVRYQEEAGKDLENAAWSSSLGQMIYGKDYAAAEDVVTHELAHGVTSYTSRLYYYYQSGALNESLSDIFGELSQRTFDKTDGWLLGERLPGGAVRNMMDPPATPKPDGRPQPDKMTSANWYGDFLEFDNGGVHTNSGVGNKAAYLITDGGTFNGKTVRGLGINKAAELFYRVNAFTLTSSSDYGDLSNALKQTCKVRIGKQPKSKDGVLTAAFTSSDCRQVAAALAATEMDLPPPVHPIPAEAGHCPAGQRGSPVATENFEASDIAKFKYLPNAAGFWMTADYYAASNRTSIFAKGFGQFDTNLSQIKGVTIPTGAYLRFAHFHKLKRGFDNTPVAGGVVEYKISSGKWRRVPASMFLDNPYNTTLGGDGALKGQQAFGGFSGGWTSSRLDLKSLAGKSVRFRFRLATDFQGSDAGWYLDDINIYTCRTPATATVASAEAAN